MEDSSLDDFLDTDADATDEVGSSDEEAPSDAEQDPTDAGNEPTDDERIDADESSSERVDDAVDPTEATDDADGVEPAAVTMTVSPAGADCNACGERVRRRWTDGGALVCRDCKEW